MINSHDIARVYPRLKGVGAAILTAGLAVGAATLPGQADAKSLKLTYTGYLGGMPILDMTATIDVPDAGSGGAIGDGAYRVDATIDTTGNFDLLSPFHAKLTGQGDISQSQAKTRQFQLKTKTRQRQETITVTYDQSGKATIVADPALKPNRQASREADAANAIDPASAIVSLATSMKQQATGCGGPFPVFNGTRRYDVVMKDLGSEALAPLEHSAYQGTALKCQATLVPAGKPDGKDTKTSKMHTDSAVFWLGKTTKDAVSVPVRISAHNGYGEMILDLVNAE